MPRSLTAADRTALIKLATSLPKGDEDRRAILAGLAKTARFQETEKDEGYAAKGDWSPPVMIPNPRKPSDLLPIVRWDFSWAPDKKSGLTVSFWLAQGRTHLSLRLSRAKKPDLDTVRGWAQVLNQGRIPADMERLGTWDIYGRDWSGDPI